jgi:hypothetical protein
VPLGRHGVAVIAAAVGVLAVSPGKTLHAANGPAGRGVFASGTANGRVWRLAAVNLADSGYRCLPGSLSTGRMVDLLRPGFLPGLALGNVAFLTVYPGRPSIGFAFLQLRPGVSRVTADLGDGTRLRLGPSRSPCAVSGSGSPGSGIRARARRGSRPARRKGAQSGTRRWLTISTRPARCRPGHG